MALMGVCAYLEELDRYDKSLLKVEPTEWMEVNISSTYNLTYTWSSPK